MHKFIVSVLFAGMWIFPRSRASAQTTQPVDDAAVLYVRAGKLLEFNHIDSPSESTLNYSGIPPFPPEWWTIEKAAWEANAPALELMHQALTINVAHWPNDPVELMPMLNVCRALANEKADAALYQHLQGDNAGAIESVRDLLHMADLLLVWGRQEQNVYAVLVSSGVEAMAADRMMVIFSDVTLTSDQSDTKDLQRTVAFQLSRSLLMPLYDIKKLSDTYPTEKESRDRFIESLNRVNTERAMAGMSLGCHFYYLTHDRWPDSMDELLGDPQNVPIDPWGDGKQRLGYVLIKGGLPDGGDRPLLYSRLYSSDGLFYRLDRPEYSIYVDDGSGRPSNQQKHGGQFRDVTRWVPGPRVDGAPTTRPLE